MRRNSLRQRPQLLFVEGLLILFIGILLLTLVPWSQRFETQVLATQLSFDVELPQSEPSRRFLDSIRNIEQIDLQGSYPDALTLSGDFSDPKIGQQTELKIELPYPYSQIQLKPVEDANAPVVSDLELKTLQLQDETKVSALRYTPFNRQLDLEFNHTDVPDPFNGSLVNIDLGPNPLLLTLVGYRLQLPNLKLEDPDGNQPLTVTFTPDITDLALALPQQGSLSLELPSLEGQDTFRWFWGGLPVSDVEFITAEQRGTDLLERSSIIQGKVRQGERTLDLEADQFLLLKNPGIQKLRYLQLSEKEGIEVRGVGKSTNIQVGLDPDFPIKGLRSNFLTRFFPADTAIAIISFAGAMIASLLVWLADNLFKSPNSDD
ncbi:MAG: hypothetical protein AAGA83_11440 [Cyanobacteria bacterium P01_F01_bin.116]